MKRYAIVEVPENEGDNVCSCFGTWWVIFNGPVELVKAACKEAGVKFSRDAKPGDLIMNDEGRFFKGSMKRKFYDFRLVIPADHEPCPNCQNIRDRNEPMDVCGMPGELKCDVCGRSESEWTYVPEPEPCPNCQNAKDFASIQKYISEMNLFRCTKCNCSESKWTYAKEPEWGGIGSGIM